MVFCSYCVQGRASGEAQWIPYGCGLLKWSSYLPSGGGAFSVPRTFCPEKRYSTTALSSVHFDSTSLRTSRKTTLTYLTTSIYVPLRHSCFHQ